MLVLTRKQQQQIQIGEGVTITILKVKGNTVRIGIEAPNDVKIVRAELEPEEEPAPAEEAEPQAAATRIDQIETATAGNSQSKDDYRVLSFRVKQDSSQTKRNDSPRDASMRDFLAARATANSVG